VVAGTDAALANGDDGTVQLWNVADSARPTALGSALSGSTGNVASVAFSPDMRTLATGSLDGLVRL
jgi:WD40 repeat protein